MKYTMMGFSQERMLELGMDVVHAAILRWFVDFVGTGKMETIDVSGRPHHLIRPNYVSKQLPCLRLNSRQAIHRRLGDLVDMGILTRSIAAGNRRKTFYGFGEHYESLLFKLSTTIDKSEKSETLSTTIDNVVNTDCHSCQPTLTDSSIIDSSIKDNLPAKAGKKKDYHAELKKKFDKAMGEDNLEAILVYGLELKNEAPFSNYPKEWTCAKRVIRKVHTVCNGVPEKDFLFGIVRAYAEKKRTSGAEFWKDAPYMPSALNVRFDQAFEYMRKKAETSEASEELRESISRMEL